MHASSISCLAIYDIIQLQNFKVKCALLIFEIIQYHTLPEPVEQILQIYNSRQQRRLESL